MNLNLRVAALERKAGPIGRCSCPGVRANLLWVRDTSVAEPPLRVCGRCGRTIRRVLIRTADDPWPGGPGYREFDGLRDFYLTVPATPPPDWRPGIALLAGT